MSEDKLSILTGFGILLMAFTAYFLLPFGDYNNKKIELEEKLVTLQDVDLPFNSVEDEETAHKLTTIERQTNLLTHFFTRLKIKPQKWRSNPIRSFSFNESNQKKKIYSDLKIEEQYARELAVAMQKQYTSKENVLQEDLVNAKDAFENWLTIYKAFTNNKLKKDFGVGYSVFSYGLLLLFLGSIFAFLAFIKNRNKNVFPFLKGFSVLFILGLAAYLLSAQESFKDIGLGYALWAIVLGLFISNIIGIPKWLEPALQHELFIKTGLVLLGAEILFGKILAIGLPGIFVAWFVTPIVLVSTFWFGQRILKIGSKTLNMTISADMSVCGVSAAIATAAACGAKKEELTTAIGMSMVFTSIMMVALPAFINYMEMPEVLGGAWLGGTIDATGAVVAAGAFLGEKALSVAATIKMIQNILIGVVAFFVAVYWTSKVNKTSQTQKIGWGEVWSRFPKFILGFIGASLLFSTIHALVDVQTSSVLLENGVLGFTKTIRGWLFCLAFVSIGLSTNFKVLKKQFSGGKPFILYLVGQTFNLCLTLLVAYVVFYKIFPNITESI